MKTIYLTDSREWYQTQEQAQAYLDLMSQGYASGIVQSEDGLLNKNLENICKSLPDIICYLDLGPGDGKKTRFLCHALHQAGKLSMYAAIDIQPKFLTIAEEIKEKFNVPIRALNISFEDFLGKAELFTSTPKFIYLGATYGNFDKDYIETRLCSFMDRADLVYLSSGLCPDNLNELVSSYSASINIFLPLLKKYGLGGGEMKVKFNPNNSSIEQGYEKGDTFYVFGISKKHSVSSFKEQVSKFFDGEYFVERNHIGFLGKKKG